MAKGNHGPRVSVYSGGVILPPFTPTEQQWESLTSYLKPGHSIPIEARSRIERACDWYLESRQAEMGAPLASEAEELMRQAVELGRNFRKLALSTHDYSNDATSQVSIAIGRAMRDARVILPKDDLSYFDPITTQWHGYEGSEATFSIRINASFLQDLARGIEDVLADAARDVRILSGSTTAGFRPGDAFREWVLAVRQVLVDLNSSDRLRPKSTQYPIGAFVDSAEPGPFSMFMYSLLGLLPEDLRDSVASEAAMADRVRNAVRSSKSQQGG